MKEHLDNVVVNWLTEEGIPFHIVRSVAFREMLTSFLKVSVRGTTTYTPPRERRLTGIARKKYGDQAARVKEWIAKGCKTASISVDGWTSPAGVSYWGVILHFLDVLTFKPVSLTLAVRRKAQQTGEELAKTTREILSHWGLWKPKEERFITHVVSDTTSVNPKMVDLLSGQGEHEWIPCACHLLQLVVNAALILVKSLLQRHRNIVRFFKKSPQKRAEFLKLQEDSGKKPKSLVAGCPTRWSGTCDMLDRNIELKEEITEMIGIREAEEECPTTEKQAQKWARRLTVEEWQISADLLKILTPLNRATKEFQANTAPTISLVIPYVSKIRKSCDLAQKDLSYSPVIRKVAKIIFSGIEERFSKTFKSPIYAIATLIDPITNRFFKTCVPSLVREEVEKFVLSKVKEFDKVQNGEKVTTPAVYLHNFLDEDDYDSAQDGEAFNLDLYVSQSAKIRQPEAVPPFLSQQHQVIRELYIAICGIPAASSEIERLFSTCGFINSKLRCSMNPQNVEDRSLMKKNALSLEEFCEDKYPGPTPKLTNWLDSLPEIPVFFPKDDKQEQEENHGDDKEEEKNWELEQGIKSESEDDEEIPIHHLQSGEWWVGSNAPKSFQRSMREFESQSFEASDEGRMTTRDSRKRKRQPEENQSVKRRKFSHTPLKRPPQLGQTVYLHYTRDCTCKKPIAECTCDQWYRGTVLEELPPRDNGDRVFFVDFDCGDNDTMKWKANGENDYWSKG